MKLTNLAKLILGLLMMLGCQEEKEIQTSISLIEKGDSIIWVYGNSGDVVRDSLLINSLNHNLSVNKGRYVPRIGDATGFFYKIFEGDTVYTVEYLLKDDTMYFANSPFAQGRVNILVLNERKEEENKLSFYDSLRTSFIDTSSLLGKRQWIMNQFLIDYEPSAPDYDTLFDINYDGIADYIIGFYYQAGSGLKNGINVFINNPQANCYYRDSLLSDIANPSIYIEDNLITGFYLPNGAGECVELHWLNNNWTVVKRIEVDNLGKNSQWIVTNLLRDEIQKIKHPYAGIPPQKILRNNYGED